MNEDEYNEQCALIEWCKLSEGKYPELKLIHASANGGKRHIATAVKLKKSGVKAGVPDLFLPVPRGSQHGLFIEMKKQKRKGSYPRLEESQKTWLTQLQEQGYATWVAYGAEDAKAAITSYLKGIALLTKE